MRKYKFEVLLYQPNDEFGEFLNKTNTTGCDDVQKDFEEALAGFAYDYDLKLVEYTNND